MKIISTEEYNQAIDCMNNANEALKELKSEKEKLQKQVEFFKKAATNLTGTNFILQHAISEFEKYTNEQASLCSLAITACGTDEKSAYVHRLYRDRFKDKLKDFDIEKILLEGERLLAAAPLTACR